MLLRFGGCAVGFAIVSKLITLKKLPLSLTAAAWIVMPIYVLFLNALLHPVAASPALDHGDVLRQVNWLPFYYFYFSSDQNALSSFANYLKIYTPLGALLWLIINGRRENAAWAALAAALIQTGLEVVGFWLYFQRPDVTNVLIAALGGGVGFAICMWLKRSLADGSTLDVSERPADDTSSGAPQAYASEETSSRPCCRCRWQCSSPIARSIPSILRSAPSRPERLQRLWTSARVSSAGGTYWAMSCCSYRSALSRWPA